MLQSVWSCLLRRRSLLPARDLFDADLAVPSRLVSVLKRWVGVFPARSPGAVAATRSWQERAGKQG